MTEQESVAALLRRLADAAESCDHKAGPGIFFHCNALDSAPPAR